MDLVPVPGSGEEFEAFARIQTRLAPMYRRIFSEPKEPRSVLVVPSMSLDPDGLAKIPGVIHYEERLLCLLMLLRMPRTQLTYVTSVPIDPAVVDYYLHLLPGVPGNHARERLTLISCDDASLEPLTSKILHKGQILKEIQASIRYPDAVHMTCFNTTASERTLAVQLDTPMYACDPALTYLGNKTMGRRIFAQVGIARPEGAEDLRDRGDLVDALVSLKARDPRLRRAVVKLNEGFSGEGNAVFSYEGIGEGVQLRPDVDQSLAGSLQFEGSDETWDGFEAKIQVMGAVAEEMIEGPPPTPGGPTIQSPSVQVRIDPLGEIELVSTHDQVLGGPSGQVFMGCTFPANRAYRRDLHQAGIDVARALRDQGVVGRFGLDFVSVPRDTGWKHYAIEINLRKGGTTLPYLMLQFLTGGSYDPGTGRYHTPTGEVRAYYATDNLVKSSYVGLTPTELIDAAVYHDLHFDAPSQQGAVFHLMGAVNEYGKIGVVAIADNRRSAHSSYEEVVMALDHTIRT